MSNLFVRHSWTTQFSPYSTLFLSGFATARNGLGAGGALAQLRYIFLPDLWAEGVLSVGQTGHASLKISKNFQNNIWTNLSFNTTTLSQPPHVSFVAGRQMTPNLNFYSSLSSGDFRIGEWGRGFDQEHSSMSVGCMHSRGNQAWNVDVGGGIDSSHVQSSYSYIVPKRGLFHSSVGSGMRLRVSANVSTSSGLSGSFTAEKRLKHSRVGVTVEAGYQQGLLLKLRWSRLGQKLTLPFTLSTIADPRNIILACLIPLVSGLLVDYVFVGPQSKRRLGERLERIKQMNSEQFETKKTEALDAQRLLSNSSQRKMEQERAKGGLVIMSALYGKEGMEIDVTVSVQALVNNSQLVIPGGYSKSGLVGFYDPAYGEAKNLTVVYRFHGQLHRVVVGDSEPLACPLRGHLTQDDVVEGVPVLDQGVLGTTGIVAPNPPSSFGDSR
jgi:DnaJ family protein C protein 11